MAKRMTRPGGRMFWVGDDMQSIYGFCGADNDALEQIGREFACEKFPMTVTFRCAKAVVDLARTIVPDYRAADANPEGVVRSVTEDEFVDEVLVPGQDAIICRRTAPLISMAYALISRGVACHVEGREIGKGLLVLVDRWSVKTISALSDKLTAYRDKETAKLLADKKEMQADALGDKVDALFVLIGSLPKGSTVADLRVKINALFADTPDGQKAKTVTLLTAHRSKGLEYNRVYGLGVAKFMPSKYAKQDWQVAQETHLEYVLYTRAIREYVDVVVAE
jgi:superfamily I DNA/RNA helicase